MPAILFYGFSYVGEKLAKSQVLCGLSLRSNGMYALDSKRIEEGKKFIVVEACIL